MSTFISRISDSRNRSMLQAAILLGVGVLCLLGALLLQLNFRIFPIGLFLFGLGMLIAAACERSHLMIPGLFFTFLGAAFFLGFKKILPFDNALLIIAIGFALLGVALAARRGHVSAGALTPALFILLVGIIQYPPTKIAPILAPFILSLWFPAFALIILGLVYGFVSMRKG